MAAAGFLVTHNSLPGVSRQPLPEPAALGWLRLRSPGLCRKLSVSARRAGRCCLTNSPAQPSEVCSLLARASLPVGGGSGTSPATKQREGQWWVVDEGVTWPHLPSERREDSPMSPEGEWELSGRSLGLSHTRCVYQDGWRCDVAVLPDSRPRETHRRAGPPTPCFLPREDTRGQQPVT